MDQIAAYILRVCCSALIAGVLLTIGGDGPGGKVRRLICGLFMTFVVISPLKQIHLDEIWELPEEAYREGQDISAAAQEEAMEEICSIIIQRTRAYILDEAGSLDARIEVTAISLDPDTLEPAGVELTGQLSPYDRSILSDYMEDTLGIEKEAQVWKEHNP